MSPEYGQKIRFVADRMLGTLCRYLRFMGYDTVSANNIDVGTFQEDTLLLMIARDEGRMLLTRDRELAVRAGERGVLVRADDVLGQVGQLLDAELIDGVLRMTRCSLCNTELREATSGEIAGADYAPKDNGGFSFFFCPSCRKLYWDGSHGKHLADRTGLALDTPERAGK